MLANWLTFFHSIPIVHNGLAKLRFNAV